MFKTLSLLALVAVFFASCGGSVDRSKPESVALAFSKAMGNLDIAGAKALASKKGAEGLAAMEGLMGMMPAEAKTKAKEESKGLKEAKCTVDGDKATCTVCCAAGGGDAAPLTLVKEDGKWAVDFSKDGGNTTPDPTTTPEPTTTPDSTATDTTATHGGGH